jgi:hypothetical protein
MSLYIGSVLASLIPFVWRWYSPSSTNTPQGVTSIELENLKKLNAEVQSFPHSQLRKVSPPSTQNKVLETDVLKLALAKKFKNI